MKKENIELTKEQALLLKARAKKPFNAKRFIIRAIESFFVILGVAIILFPIFWIVVRSFAPNDYVPIQEWSFFPKNPTAENFIAVLTKPLKGCFCFLGVLAYRRERMVDCIPRNNIERPSRQ